MLYDRAMLRLIAIFIPLLLVAGCQKEEAKVDPASVDSTDVRPYTPASGAIGGPVQGSESVGGAGMGGVGQAAKDRARSAASATPTGIPAPTDAD